MAEYTKPLPIVNDLNRPHWEGACNREFLIQRCADCGHVWFPPEANCSHCLSTNTEWIKSSGRGTVVSFVVYYQGWLPGYRDAVPYNVAIVELEEGVRFINNIVGVPNESIEIGMPVEVTFEDVTPDITIPRFKPASV